MTASFRRLFAAFSSLSTMWSERYQLPGRLRIVKWCAAPADASEDELRRIFSIVDEPQCDDMVVWFYSSLEDIGRKPFDVALLERSGKDAWPTIRRPT